MFCPSCGKEIPENSSFCPLCGAAVKPQGVDAPAPVEQARVAAPAQRRAEENDIGILAARYADVATAEDLSVFLESRIRLLDTFYWLPFISITALIMVVSLTYNSNTFWLVYPELGYFFVFVAVVLFLGSIYIPYIKGRPGSLPLFLRAAYRRVLTEQYLAAKGVLKPGSPTEWAAETANNEFVHVLARFRGSVSESDLQMLLKRKLDGVVNLLIWMVVGSWVLVVAYWEIWTWVGSGAAGYMLGFFVALVFLGLLYNPLSRLGAFAENLRKLRTPSDYQTTFMEEYLEAKRSLAR